MEDVTSPARVTLINLGHVKAQTTLSRASIYRLAAIGKFPRPVKLGEGQNSASAWVQEEIDAWVLNKIKNRDQIQIGEAS